ncbi:MAG: tryptophan--tRNA ligase [bacterium]|nr:tryptophan--tRNA ligase [bacterium]
MRILSGIQPTGAYHIGNYLGAIRHWVKLQEDNECFFFIADLHALTQPQDPKILRNSTIEKAIELVALGLDPARSTIFVQSQIKEPTELAWILSTIVPVGELERMTQYKEKSKKKGKESANMGLLNYPVLQAADILLYKTEGVPIGKDQVQHLELSRNLAKRFNQKFGDTFPVPKAMVPSLEMGAKILSLQDPKRKMSKSDPPDSQLGMLEDPDSIRRKIANAVTDSGKQIVFNPAEKPGISNLLVIFSLFSEQSIKEVEKKFQKKGYAPFKKALGELLVEKLEPFRKKYEELKRRELYIQEILRQGQKKAQSTAQNTMEEVREKIGLLSF